MLSTARIASSIACGHSLAGFQFYAQPRLTECLVCAQTSHTRHVSESPTSNYYVFPTADVGKGLHVAFTHREEKHLDTKPVPPFPHLHGHTPLVCTDKFSLTLKTLRANSHPVTRVQLGYVEGCKDGNPGPIPLGLGPKQQINTRNKEPLSFVSVGFCEVQERLLLCPFYGRPQRMNACPSSERLRRIS